MRYFCLLLFAAYCNYSVIAQHYTRGKVVDSEENPIANVKISEPGTSNVVYSKDDGTFLLTFFESESKLVFSHEDFDTLRKSQDYNANTIVFLTAKREANAYHLGYSVGFLDFKNKNKNKNLQNMPYLLGESDVIRQLQMLPGIEQGSEGYSNLFVRGGEVDQNLMLYNGSPIYNPTHLFGLFSTFHNRSIENTAVYRGIASSKYGGRGSSIISLESKKTSDFSGVIGEFELTPLNAGVYIESIKKDKSYFTVAGRRSWYDLLLPAESKQNNLNANIYDVQLNFGKYLENKDKLDFSLMHSRDLYFINFTNSDTSTGSAESFGLTTKWYNLVGSAKYSTKISERLSGEVSVHYSGYRSVETLEQDIYDKTVDAVSSTEKELSRGIRDVGLHSDWIYAHNNDHLISFGFQSQSRFFLTGKYDYKARDFPGQKDISFTEGTKNYSLAEEFALYGEDKYRVGENTIVDGGIRAVIYAYDKFYKVSAEPRIHVSSFLKNRDVIKFGYNRHNQFVSQLNLGKTGSPNNIWVPATSLVAPLTVDFLEAGYEKKMGQEYSVSINFYLKDMKNLIKVADLGEAGNYSQDWQSSVVQGDGRSYGMEIFLQKSKGNFTGWLSYAYSNSVREFTELYSEEFRFTYDRPHMFKAYANYSNPSSNWNYGINYMVGSGQLFTLPIGKYRDIDGNLQLEYNTLNNYRSPLYQRVDISVTRLKDVYSLGQEWRFYLYNVLGSRNPFAVSADFTNSSYTELKVNRNYLAWVPGIAYVVKFN